MSYMPQTVLDKDGNPVTIAVQTDGGVAPGGMAPPSALSPPAPDGPSWMDGLKNWAGNISDNAAATGQGVAQDVSRLGALTALGPGPGAALFVKDAFGAPAVQNAFASAKEGLNKGVRAVSNALLPNTQKGEGPPPAAPAAPTAFTAPGGTGGAGAAGMPPGGELSARFTLPVGGGGGGANPYAKDEKAARALGEKEKAANQTAFEVGQQQAHAEAGFAQEAVGLAEKQRQEQVDFEKHRGAALDAQYKAYQSAADEVAKVNTTIDPNKFWASKATGSRIFAALGAAMGAMGAALTGGPNYAQQIIDKAVNDDIDAQKSMVDYQLKKGNEKVAGQQTLYGMMRARFGDDATALAATQSAALNVVQKKLEAAKAGLGSQEQRAKLEQLQVQVDKQQQQAAQQLHGLMDDSAIKHGHLQVERAKVQAEFAAKAAKGVKELPPEAVDRLGGYEAASKIFANLQKSFETKTGPGSFLAKHLPGTDAGQYENERKAAAETAARAISGGRPTPGLMEAILDLIPTSSTPDKAGTNQFRVLQEDNSMKRAADLDAYRRSGHNVSAFPADSATKYGSLKPL